MDGGITIARRNCCQYRGIYESLDKCRFIATPHRVVPPKRDRYALTFFFNTNDETIAEPLPTCISPGDQPKYDPIAFHDYQVSYLDGNYIYSKDNN